MTGDTADMLARLKAVLPAGWFPDETPVLDALLTGCATAASWLYGLLGYVRQQTRIASATDGWLDIVAADFFGGRLQRNGQSDTDFRNRIQREFVREHGTRRAVVSVLNDLRGRTPVIFEPARPADTGGYAASSRTVAAGLAYGTVGGWGSLAYPFQCFVTAYRPTTAGIPQVAGWGTNRGGYGGGGIEYATLDFVAAQVADTDIYNAVASVMPVAAVAWTRISK